MFMVRFPIALGRAKFLKVCLLRNIFAFLNWKITSGMEMVLINWALQVGKLVI